MVPYDCQCLNILKGLKNNHDFHVFKFCTALFPPSFLILGLETGSQGQEKYHCQIVACAQSHQGANSFSSLTSVLFLVFSDPVLAWTCSWKINKPHYLMYLNVYILTKHI